MPAALTHTCGSSWVTTVKYERPVQFVDGFARPLYSDSVSAAVGGRLGRRVRLESVQNAVEQARFLSASLMGAEGGYRAVPWFWSNQFDLKLQFAGLGRGSDECVVTEGPSEGAFSVLRYAGDELVRVESVNCPLDHVAARRVLARPCCRPGPDEASRPGFSLRSARTCRHG